MTPVIVPPLAASVVLKASMPVLSCPVCGKMQCLRTTATCSV